MLVPTREQRIVEEYTGATVVDGELVLTLASGDRVRASVPVEGVPRLRTGPSDQTPERLMLESLPDAPASWARSGDRAVVRGPGVEASWSCDGRELIVGPYERIPREEGDKFPFTAGGRATDLDGRPGWMETVWLPAHAAVYGGGESFQGPDLRGRQRLIRNQEAERTVGVDAAYLNVPFFWTDAGWGVLVHTGGTVRADIGRTHSECLALAVEGTELDLFILLGGPEEIRRRYLALRGAPPQPPDWAFGVWMSRSSYFTEDEMHDVLGDLEEAGCPVAAVHVDEWMQEPVLQTACWTTPADRRRFPQGWGQRLTERGVRTSLWIAPTVHRDAELAEELAAAGYLVRGPDGEPAGRHDNPDALLIDLTNAEAERWFRQRITRTMAEECNAAFLVDFGEEVPDDAVFCDGRPGWQVGNEYAVRYQRAVWLAASDARGDDFALICRSGTAGAHRYPAHWVGDTPSTWTGLVPALRATLALALSGFGVITHDIGGYWTAAAYEHALALRETMKPHAMDADVDPELYVRWTQWGAFSPIMRFHGVGAREPTAYAAPRGSTSNATSISSRPTGGSRADRTAAHLLAAAVCRHRHRDRCPRSPRRSPRVRRRAATSRARWWHGWCPSRAG